MFCYKCGQKLNDDAAFCHRCGTHIDLVSQSSNLDIHETGSKELNREALRIYLHDILTLECIKSKYAAKVNHLNQQISSVTGGYFEKKYDFINSESWRGGCTSLYFLYKDGKCYLWVERDSLHGIYAHTDTHSYLPGRTQHLESMRELRIYDIEANYDQLTNLPMWSSWPMTYESGYFAKRKKATKARDAFVRSYADFKKIATQGLQDNRDRIASLKKVSIGVTKELKDVNNLLAKGYSLNIIPSQFRNSIHAIYYLYDFINSSNLSFATALLHFDLHKIQAKLDKIIQQQQEIIIQQSIIIAQNQQMISQNQMQLQKLADIESNTEQAATYSAIAANNAEACAWIGLANYLK